LRSSASATDLQATVTEVRPGATEEEYITSGFLNTTDRALGAGTTTLDPVPTYLKADHRSLRAGRYTLVRIPIDPIGHVFRAGTRLRVVLSAPGGDRPAWAFAAPSTGGKVLDTVGLGAVAASSLVVNVVSGVPAPAALPMCGSLRGEPCRAYAPLGNQG
ncbi:MAG: CocE/NonD family hydrolase C-terminal non-catalytic domain-containing protein, partial [Acidimicrobiales bacterium]